MPSKSDDSVTVPGSRPRNRRARPRTAPRGAPAAQAAEPGRKRRAVTAPQESPSRPVHRRGLAPHIINGRADRNYVIASPGFFGPNYYESLGYQRVERTPDGPDFHFGSAGGLTSALEFQGGIVMECDLETFRRREQHGDFGSGGQDYVDQIEARMIDKTVNADASRGIHRQALVPIEADQGRHGERSLMTDAELEEEISHAG